MKLIVALLSLLAAVACLGYAQLTQITSCVCPGHELVYECTTENATATIWKGTILDGCLSSEIILRHSEFRSQLLDEGIHNRTCQDIGLVVVRPISSDNYSYTSHLVLLVGELLGNRSVVCEALSEEYYDIYSDQIRLSKDVSDEQLVVQLTAIYNGDLTFSWNSVHRDCPWVYYNINSSNCGVCPENVTSTTVTCTGVYGGSSTVADDDVCVIFVQSFVCDNIQGTISDIVTVSIQNRLNVVVITEVLFSMIIRSVYLEILRVESHNYTLCDYSVVYYTPDAECDTHSVGFDSCKNDTCIDFLNVTISPCSNASEIYVNVTPSDNSHCDSSFTDFSYTTRAILITTQSQGYTDTNILIVIIGSLVGGITIVGILVVIFLTVRIKILYQSTKHERQQTQGPSGEQSHNVRAENSHPNELQFIGVYSMAQNSDEQADFSTANSMLSLNNDQEVIYENKHHNIDELLTLDTLLIKIKAHATPKWYQFGVAAGISKETLDEFVTFPPEESIVEILDLWLRNSESKVTWRDVAEILREIGLYLLAERVMKIYKTGKLSDNQSQIPDFSDK